MAYLADLGQRVARIDVHDTGEATYRVDIDGTSHEVDCRQIDSSSYSVLIAHRSYVAEVVAEGDEYEVTIDGDVYRFRLADERRHKPIVLGAPEEEHGRREIRAQMPGKVVDVFVSAGDAVDRGQALLVVEAMKMENEIKAPSAGEVKEITVAPGDVIESRQLLVVIE